MKRILLVDDEKDTAAVFQTALTGAGYEVFAAPDGKTATDLIAKEHFDGILLDQMLPDAHGNEILKGIKANEATKNIPVAMLTNFGDDKMIKEALNTGAQDYILKYQVSTDDLIVKVKTLVGQ